MKYPYHLFGATYGQGAYGTSIYSCSSSDPSCTTSSTTGSSPAAASSGLTNTGIAVVAFATLACLIIFVALIVRFVRRKPQPVAETVRVDQEPPEERDEQ